MHGYAICCKQTHRIKNWKIAKVSAKDEKRIYN